MTGMRNATIKMVLRDKIDKWVATFETEEIKDLVRKNVIITGGAINSLMVGESPNDYDMYFKTREAALSIAWHYVNRFNNANTLKSINHYKAFVKEEQVKNIKDETENRIKIYMKSAGIASETQTDYTYFESRPDSETEAFFNSIKKDPLENLAEIESEIRDSKKLPFRPIFLTDNAITLSNKVQVIIRFYGTPEEIHKNFDFVHATGVYDYSQDELHISKEIYESVLAKALIYNGSLYPIASLFRIRKFLKRGWRITAGQMLKIAAQISELDLSNPHVLKEQLIGVDFAYMQQLINLIQNREPGTRVDSVYLAKLIDEVFEEGVEDAV
jgi:predicted transcriptional regulator